MSENEIIEHAKKIGAEYEGAFSESLLELQNALGSIDPIHLLAVLSFHVLTEGIGSDRAIPPKTSLLQHHVEVLQALTLQRSLSDFEHKPATPDRLQTIGDLVYTCSEAFALRRFSALDQSLTVQERYRLQIIEDFRLSTQVLRNWGHPEQVVDIVKRLFAPLDRDFAELVGLPATALISMCEKIIEIVEARMTHHLDRLRPMILAKSIADAYEKYKAAFPEVKDNRAEFLQFTAENRINLKRAKQLLFLHSELMLPEIFELRLSDFVSAYPGVADPQKVEAVLKQWSLCFGSLAEESPERFFLGNPTWRSPMIRLSDDLYYWPIPGLFISFCIEMLEELIPSRSQLDEKYLRRRSMFLEEELEKLLMKALPRGQVYRGSQWIDTQTNSLFENDILVVIDTFAIVVEAKAGKITDPARRGGDQRLQRTIDDLLVKPSEQGRRFADFLRQSPGKHSFTTRRGVTNNVDTSDVGEIIRLSVTLDILGGHAAAYWPDLRRAGFIPTTVDPAPTLALAQLETVFDILETQSEKLHYLKRRAEFESQAAYIAEEIDLLSFYLETGFNVGGLESDGTPLMLYGSSASLDDYLMSHKRGLAAKKPYPRRTKWWTDMLLSIEKSNVLGWIECGYGLLSIPYADQVGFERRLKSIQRTVLANWQKPGHKNTVLTVNEVGGQKYGVEGCAFARLPPQARNQRLMEAGNIALTEENATKAVVIGLDVERRDYPYSVIGLVRKP
jgi:hypothetical protein